MSLQLKDLVPINEEHEKYTYYASNDLRFKGTIVTEDPMWVMKLVKEGDMTLARWESLIVQKDK